jgi:hypothetical protein
MKDTVTVTVMTRTSMPHLGIDRPGTPRSHTRIGTI